MSESSVLIAVDNVSLTADLVVSTQSKGLVVFAHGSGSSRLSPRNVFVARQLQIAGIGTMLFDLLTKAEDIDYKHRFDIELLTERLLGAIQWTESQEELSHLPIGLFGASTGAAAALKAAVRFGTKVKAVVSRGGRPDLAIDELESVQAPTLLIVGELDFEVIKMNEQAFQNLPPETTKELTIVPGATHLFEEAGTLEQAAKLATQWFNKHLTT